VHDHLIDELAAHRHGHRQRGLDEIGAQVVMGTAPGSSVVNGSRDSTPTRMVRSVPGSGAAA
jgi:hypothetical protein